MNKDILSEARDNNKRNKQKTYAYGSHVTHTHKIQYNINLTFQGNKRLFCKYHCN